MVRDLLFIKNYQLTYTLADIVKYFDENVSRWVDEEFLTNWMDISDIHHLTPDINVVQDQCIVKYKQPTWNPKSIHFTGLPKIYDDVLPHTVIKKFKLLYNPCIIAYLRQKIYKLLGS